MRLNVYPLYLCARTSSVEVLLSRFVTLTQKWKIRPLRILKNIKNNTPH